VINPWLKSLRNNLAAIVYTLPGREDAIRQKMYRSFNRQPANAERIVGAEELKARLSSLSIREEPVSHWLKLSSDRPVVDYFKQFPMLDLEDKAKAKEFLELVPITTNIEVAPSDIVCYDQQGYAVLKKYLQANGVRHVLLGGAVLCELQRYTPDMCNTGPFFGFENLTQDFNVFLVADAALTTFPAAATPRFTSRAHISAASVDHFVTQISWIRYERKRKTLF